MKRLRLLERRGRRSLGEGEVVLRVCLEWSYGECDRSKDSFV